MSNFLNKTPNQRNYKVMHEVKTPRRIKTHFTTSHSFNTQIGSEKQKCSITFKRQLAFCVQLADAAQASEADSKNLIWGSNSETIEHVLCLSAENRCFRKERVRIGTGVHFSAVIPAPEFCPCTRKRSTMKLKSHFLFDLDN